MHEDTYVRTDERERFYTKLIVRPWICGQMCLRAVLGRSKHTRVHTTRVYLWQSRFVPKTCCTGARKISIDLGRDFCRDARTSRGCLEKKYPFKNTFSIHFNSPFFFLKASFGISPLNAKSSFVPPSVLGISHGVGILRGWWPPVERAPMNHPNRYRRHRPTLPSFFPSFARKRW